MLFFMEIAYSFNGYRKSPIYMIIWETWDDSVGCQRSSCQFVSIGSKVIPHERSFIRVMVILQNTTHSLHLEASRCNHQSPGQDHITPFKNTFVWMNQHSFPQSNINYLSCRSSTCVLQNHEWWLHKYDFLHNAPFLLHPLPLKQIMMSYWLDRIGIPCTHTYTRLRHQTTKSPSTTIDVGWQEKINEFVSPEYR